MIPIPQIIPDNIEEIALSRVLAKTPFVGFLGNTGAPAVVFAVANIPLIGMVYAHTYNKVRRSVSARYVDHAVINGIPVSEFIGDTLKTMEFTMELCSTVCIDPLTTYETLEKMVRSGEPQSLFIDGKNYEYWTIRKIEAEESLWAQGRPAVIEIDISLVEYRDTLPTLATQKLREDELRRKDTGKGGPDRLPGDKKFDMNELSKKIGEEFSGRVRGLTGWGP